MDPTSHIPSVTLFYYMLNAIELSATEQGHLAECRQCQSALAEFEDYLDHVTGRAA